MASFEMEKALPKMENARSVEHFKSKGRYKKGGSAGSTGTDYQVGLLVVVLLNSLKRFSNWRLSTENESAGKFDDAVVEWPTGAFLIQAKHKESKKKVTLNNLMSVNSKKDEFSLPKYFLSYQKIKENFRSYHRVVICTNLDVKEEVLPFLNESVECSENVLHHKAGNSSCYTFNNGIVPFLRAKVEEYYNNLTNRDVEVTEITEENLKDFLAHLQIYFNYPPEDRMEKIIDNLLSVADSSGKISVLELFSKVKSWFQQKQGEYFSEVHAKAVFAEIRRDKYFQTLRILNVSFNENNLDLKSKRVFQIIPQGGYLLRTLQIYAALQDDESKILCNEPNGDAEILKQIVEIFELPRYIALLIFWSDNMNRYSIQVSDMLRRTLKEYEYKKVIIFGKSDTLIQQIGFGDCCDVSHESVRFEDLSKDTRERLLRKSNVTFQGEIISLEELIGKEKLDDQKKSLHTEILEKLILNENIKVGSLIETLDAHVTPYYVERTFEREVQETGEIEKRRETISEQKIYNVPYKVVLIQDDAGAGKSTVLAHLAETIKEKDPHLWVILIKLNAYTGILNEFKERNKRTITLMELLNSSNATKLTNWLEEIAFLQDKKVVLLIDGVDEISPDYTDLVLDLLIRCQKEANFAKVLVTTRPYMAGHLEAILKVKSFKLQPFTQQSQIKFLTNYWSHNLGIDEMNRKRCEKYAEDLLRKTSWINSSNKHFASVPLVVRMLAEIFEESSRLKEQVDWEGCREFLSGKKDTPNLPNRMNIGKIYETFIQKKRNVFKAKSNPTGNTSANLSLVSQFDKCLVAHRMLALEEILLKWECELFTNYLKSLDDIIMVAVLQIGIVQRAENRFYFSHRTFAEYFVAEIILSELQLQMQNPNKQFQRFFFEKVLLTTEFTVVRAFFNHLLEKAVHSIPPNIFQCYESIWYKTNLWKNSYLIHKLAQEGCKAILQLLFKCINFKVVKDMHVYTPPFIKNAKYSNILREQKFLVQQGGVNFKNDANKTPLFSAVIGENLEVVMLLVEHGAIIFKYILYEAIRKNNTEMVEYLLEKTLEAGESILKNPMIPYTLAYLGRTDQLGDLLDSGLDVNSRAERDKTLIMGAARGGQLDTIRYLVHQGADVNSRDKNGETALHSIARMPSRIETAKLLVELGIEVNAKNKWGITALDSSRENAEMLKFLIKNGADVNSKNKLGQTLLLQATHDLATFRFLIGCGCDVNLTDRVGHTALHLAAMNDCVDVVRFLLYDLESVNITNMDVNLRDRRGRTPLHSTSIDSDSRKDMIKYLLECGADANIRDSSGETVLHFAALYGHLDNVRSLVRFTDLDIKNDVGQTALHLAAWWGKFSTVKCLVEHSADVNVCDGKGRTALHLAASQPWEESSAEDYRDIMKLLVERGVPVDLKDSCGDTPITLARKNGNRWDSKTKVFPKNQRTQCSMM